MPASRRTVSLARPLRTGLSLLFPEGALVAAAVVAIRWQEARTAVEPFLPYLLPTMLVAGAALSWRFHRTRLLLAIVVLALAERALHLLPTAADGVVDAGPHALHAAAVLIAANLAALAFLRERALLSAEGVRRVLAVVAQLGAVAALYGFLPPELPDPLAVRFLPERALSWASVPQVVALAFLVALVAQAARAVWRPETVARGFFWATVAALLAFASADDPVAVTLALGTGGIVLVVAAIEHAHAMAYRDELTGLPARRALDEAMQRLEGRYTVAMVDVDHFKQFNDRHGHDVGDQVLRLVASRLARVDHGGRAYRYGGEEFTVLLPDLPLEESVGVLDALRRDVESATFTVRGADRPKRKPKTPKPGRGGGHRLSVTVSIGVAERSGRATLPADVIKAADRALYRAKDAGRNRVER